MTSHSDKKKLILQQFNLSKIEWYILVQTFYLPKHRDIFIKVAHLESHHDVSGNKFSIDECNDALDECINKGLVKVTDEYDIQNIKNILAGYPEPLHKIPSLGEIDFTVEGSNLFLQVWISIGHEDIAWGAKYDLIDKRKCYFYAKDNVTMGLILFNEYLQQKRLEVHSLIPINRWSLYWWRLFDKGFKMTATCHENDS